MSGHSSSRAAHLEFGRYQITGRAGIGIAEAYRARDPDSDELVTIFHFADEYADVSRPDRLSTLTATLGVLEHPNILRVLDAGRDGRAGYVVTEWMDGATLARMIEIHSRLPEANVIRFLAQIGQALDFTRNGEMALCDVSPANVLVRNDGVAKLIPFELPGDTATPAMMLPGLSKQAPPKPPERTANKPVEFRELIFSLGTTLHEALTGQVWIRSEPPTRRSRRSRAVPTRPTGLTDRTERAIRRATDPDPAKRPATCADFLKLLRSRPLTAGTPKSDARPPSISGENRREFVRYSLGAGGNCVIYTSVFDGDPPSSEVWPLVVQDVSVGGIGLLLARRCEPGTELSVELTGGGAGSDERVGSSFPVRVVRVRRDQYGHWMHGCEFLTPLDEADLNTFLNCMGKSETV